MWRELWFKMSEGKKSEYEKIKSTNVFEFYQILQLWQFKIKQENDAIRARSKKA